ncbi:28S rRNA (cytosine-C(5))-methyltransferase-like [Antedon mediterranea]|uniref:28S rRNA (cytosine-C(5))-methyltransferase-like n=1 Tax=Antedon mediterranea TaxID=105859 RepID=UPI003AF62BC5
MLYKQAATIIESAKKQKRSVKSLLYACQTKNFRQLYALVNETLKYSLIIDDILKSTKLLQLEKSLSESFAQVCLYDLLFGKGLRGNGKDIKAVLRYKTTLRAALARLKVKAKVSKNEDLLVKEVKNIGVIPRYVRVNTLRCSVKEAVDHFTANGYKCLLTANQRKEQCSGINPEELHAFQKELLSRLDAKSFFIDVHLPFLLVFSHGCDLHADPLYLNGSVILQDKASCIPAYVLNPPDDSHVIDACAAPGNKTSHLASIMNNTGKIFAFDLDWKRLKILQKLTSKAGVKNVESKNCNFIEDVNPGEDKFKTVEYILVDPSCSGSGMVARLDHVTNDVQSESRKRLESLASFQVSILKHALSFPAVKRVVYSTCSQHRVENEEVVELILKACPSFRVIKSLPDWHKRGIKDSEVGEDCLRAEPSETRTNGFFVALFERRETDGLLEENNSQQKKLKRKRKKKKKIENSSVEMISSKQIEEVSKNKPKKKKRRKKNKLDESM